MFDRSSLQVVVAFVTCSLCLTAIAVEPERESKWTALPNLPDEHGMAGMYAGVSGGALLAAGGANFPDAPPWQGGTKVWHKNIFVLPRGEEKWSIAETVLPRELAYGVSLTMKHHAISTSDHQGLLLLGGDDGVEARRDVYLVTYQAGRVVVRPLPPLPEACTQMCGAIVNDKIYIAGGAEALDAVASRHTFWVADVNRLLNGNEDPWMMLPPWPGSERMQAIAATDGTDFYLFGGVRLTRGDDGKPTRVTPYLRDAYRYRATKNPGWEKLPDMPRPAAAAPSPAPVFSDSIAILGGVDGSLFTHDQATHPGFTRKTLLFELKSNRWRDGDALPEGVSRVTVPIAPYRDGHVLVSGEVRPGVRSPTVWWID